MGSSFFLLIAEKDVFEGDLTISGIIYTESALMPCTFVKVESFNVTVDAIIAVDFSIDCKVDQDNLMILDEESYHQIISLQRDRGPRSTAEEKSIEMEEEESNEGCGENNTGPKETEAPTLNRHSLWAIRVPLKFASYQKWD